MVGEAPDGEGICAFPSLSMQDSDGDKSDDLVVDVSNEVRAFPGHRAALCVGS